MIFDIFDFFNSDIYFTNLAELSDPFKYAIIGMVFIVGILCRVLMFRKVGKNPWIALIPFYGLYHYFEIFWYGWYGLAQFFLSGLFYLLLPVDMRLLNAGLIGYICIALYILKTLIAITAKIKLAESFGKSPAFAYGLIFVEPVFVLIIALGKCEYLGPTLRKYNNENLIDKKQIKEYKKNKSNKQYMINLYKWRSIIALIACLVTLFFAIGAISSNLIEFVKTNETEDLLKYFTVNSNILTALSAACIIPYAIEGIRKKRFSYPKWAALLHYSGTICTTLTMVFAIFIISQYDIVLAFGKYNFFLHIVCPVTILVSFMMVESGYRINIDESIICLFPFILYALIYTTKVFLIGEENGGWEDLYKLVTFAPISFSFPAMFMIALGVSLAIGKVYNYIGEIRKNKLQESWPEEASPVEIKIEAYGLGRYMGMHEESNNANLPLDILEEMAERYNIKQEELTRAYVKGVIDGSKERDIYRQYKRRDIYSIFGTPYKLSKFYDPERKGEEKYAD